MACLLYCVARIDTEVIPNILGVGDEQVCAREPAGLRVYWSDLADPETALAEGAAWKKAELKYQQVLREMVVHFTPVPIAFPAVLGDVEAIEKYFAEEREYFEEAVGRLGDAVQYELTASWTAEEQADLATPVSGREYVKRRQEAAGRVAAVDAKLKTVTEGCVREWRAQQERRQYRWYALVPRAERERFVGMLRSAGPSEGVRLRLSGPWPPGNFVKAASEAR